jgi:hypothetical protein
MVTTRSRRQTRQPTQAEHPTTLQGLGASQVPDKPGWGGGNGRPTLIERQDQNFLNAILNELTAGNSLQGRLTPASNEVLQLLQPVHRTFYLALLEVVCNPFALPTTLNVSTVPDWWSAALLPMGDGRAGATRSKPPPAQV